jgi:hypothetical protein
MKRTLLIASCVLLVSSPATSLAKKHKKAKPLGPVVTITASGNQATGDGAPSAANVICPTGTQAVGGGFRSPLLDNNAVVVTDSYRSSPRSWTVRGQVVNGEGSVTGFAYCRRTKGHPITVVTASVGFNSSGEVHTLTPTCTSGKLIGGGFAQSSTPGSDSVVFPQVSQATSPTTWTVTQVANQDGPQNATAGAICMGKIKAPRVLSQTTSATIGLFGSVSSTTPRCPRAKGKGKKSKRKLLSGGGFAASPVNGMTGAPLPVFGESHIGSSGGWLATATNGFSATGPVSLTSQAICV